MDILTLALIAFAAITLYVLVSKPAKRKAGEPNTMLDSTREYMQDRVTTARISNKHEQVELAFELQELLATKSADIKDINLFLDSVLHNTMPARETTTTPSR